MDYPLHNNYTGQYINGGAMLGSKRTDVTQKVHRLYRNWVLEFLKQGHRIGTEAQK